MNTTRFEYLLALEQLGTMSQAAQQFFISPSALSQCLKTEEEELGVKLFQKENKKMVPTPEGLIYLKGARRIVKIRRETMEKMNIARVNHHAVRIAVSPMLFGQVSSSILPRLKADFPRQEFELIRTDAKVGTAYLLNDLADFAILGCPPLNHSLLSEEVLGEDQLLLAIPRAYLRSQLTRPPVIGDCAAVPFILIKEGTYARTMENEVLAREHITLNRVYEVEDYVMARRFLEDGRGAAFLPTSMIPADASSHFFILPPESPPSFRFLLLSLKQRQTDRNIREIGENIQACWKASSEFVHPHSNSETAPVS